MAARAPGAAAESPACPGSDDSIPVILGISPSTVSQLAGDMPTYEYACTSCSHHIELVQAFTDDPLELCSACGGRLRRVFHPAGILFKGSGFYSTDKNHSRETTKAKLPDKARDETGDAKTGDAKGEKSAGSGLGAASGSAPKTVEKSA